MAGHEPDPPARPLLLHLHFEKLVAAARRLLPRKDDEMSKVKMYNWNDLPKDSPRAGYLHLVEYRKT